MQFFPPGFHVSDFYRPPGTYSEEVVCKPVSDQSSLAKSQESDQKSIYARRAQKLNLVSPQEVKTNLNRLINHKMAVHNCTLEQLTDEDFRDILEQLHICLSDSDRKALDENGFEPVSNYSFYSNVRAKYKVLALKEFLQETSQSVWPKIEFKLTDQQWKTLGSDVLHAHNNPRAHLYGCGRAHHQDPIANAIIGEFYHGIYEQVGSDTGYFDDPEGPQEWIKLIKRNNETSGYGKVMVAAPRSYYELPSQVYKSYHMGDNAPPAKSRLQFLVTANAGAKLFNDLEEAVEQFIKNECDGDISQSPIQNFKVLSEGTQKGRSDSAVFYMSERPDHRLVQKFVLNYLSPKVGNRLADPGLFGLQRFSSTSIYGILYPDHERATELFGEKPSTSTGGLISQVLTAAYKQGLNDLAKFENSQGKIEEESKRVERLNQLAQQHVASILSELKL